MQGTIELRHPILIDGQKVSSLSYDTEKITVDIYMKANADVIKSAGNLTGALAEYDYSFQLVLGIQAVVLDNPECDYLAIKSQIRGADLSKFMEVGRLFMNGVEESEDEISETSEQPSEITAETSTPQ